MLTDNLLFNYRSIRSYTMYECRVTEGAVERDLSFHVAIGPGVPRRKDVFPVYQIPRDKMAWLSDWSFNAGHFAHPHLRIGGSLGRLTAEHYRYDYVLNCSVEVGQMQIFSPARPIRFLPSEWIAVCFHYDGDIDFFMRATFRFTEVPAPDPPPASKLTEWVARGDDDQFSPDKLR